MAATVAAPSSTATNPARRRWAFTPTVDVPTPGRASMNFGRREFLTSGTPSEVLASLMRQVRGRLAYAGGRGRDLVRQSHVLQHPIGHVGNAEPLGQGSGVGGQLAVQGFIRQKAAQLIGQGDGVPGAKGEAAPPPADFDHLRN